VLACCALFALNAFLCWPLFRIEYLNEFQSNEGVLIALGRFVLQHWPHGSWFPSFDAGEPLENTYFPLVPFLTAGLAFAARCSPGLAFHFLAALTYSLAPVFLFLFARHMSGRLAPSFGAAFAWSLFSPSGFIPEMLTDMGSPWGLRRLKQVVFLGETPHDAALCLVPLALLALARYWEMPGVRRFALAAIAVAAVMASNAFGIVVIVGSSVFLLLALEGPLRPRWLALGGVLITAYLLLCRFLPPSLLALIATNSQTTAGDYRFTAAVKLRAALFLLLLAILCVLIRRLAHPMLRFAVLFLACFGGLTVVWYWKYIALLPQAHRYVLEMEAGLCLLVCFAAYPAVRRLSHGSAIVLGGLGAVLLIAVALADYRFARRLIEPADLARTVVFRQARWIDTHLPGERIMVSGDNEFWFNLFADNPQLSAGHEASAPNWVQRVAVYTIYSGHDAGKNDGPISVLWLKAFGCGAITVAGPGSKDFFHPILHPEKFDGLLPLIWREEDNSIYRVPLRSASLAHVIPASAVVARRPIHGLDIEAVQRYVAALEDPSLPEAELTWRNPEHGRIRTIVEPGQVVSVQINFDPGWKASIGGRPVELRADGLGMMVVDPHVSGECAIDLAFTGGTERLICFALSSMTALVLAGMIILPAWVKNSRCANFA
jgi:hypothetical protein